MATTTEALRRRGISTGPKRGDELFAGTDYPRAWDEYIGQDEVKDFLRAAAVSARMRNARLDHVLIASGSPGIGKSALVRLVAKEMGAGMTEVQGAIDATQALRILAGLRDGDILFVDEAHLLVSGGRAKSEWLLSFLQDGVIVTPSGVNIVPDVTVIAATTDAQKLPEPILSRFTLKPVLDSYTPEQADQICLLSAMKIFSEANLPVPHEHNRGALIEAANRNPRAIIQLLRLVRDSALAARTSLERPTGNVYSLDKMFTWSRLTYDGLDQLAQDYLLALYTAPDFTSGEKTVAQTLGESTPPRWTEKLLIKDKGFVRVCPRGRQLTPAGVARAAELYEERTA